MSTQPETDKARCDSAMCSNGENPVLAQALAYHRAGLCVIPIKRDGSKAPLVAWKKYQRERPTEEDLRKWFDKPDPPGIGIVCGQVSGNLELLDFDSEASTIYPHWCELVEAECPGLIDRLTVTRTPRPGGGYHLRYRCPGITLPGNLNLAIDPTKPKKERTLIQTRGEGGQGLAPGCPPECHPEKGLYQHHSGPPLEQVGSVSAEEREVLLHCARSFNREVKDWPVRPPRGGNLRPGDAFNRSPRPWVEIIGPPGWKAVREIGGVTYWQRPGKEGPGWSATTGYCHGPDGTERLRVFSSNASPFEDGKAYSKFAAYALLHHGGDFSAAARELRRQGYGSGSSGGGADHENEEDSQEKDQNEGSGGKAGEKEKRPTQAEVLLGLAEPVELFHDADQEAYACVPVQNEAGEHREILPCSPGGLGRWLRNRYFEATDRAPSSGTFKDVVDTLEARAIQAGPCEEVYVRVAPTADGGIVLDLGDATWRAVLITRDGWKIAERPPARLRRPKGFLALPEPERGGTLAGLWELLNIPPEQRVLAAAWLLMGLRPRGPYVGLSLRGEQGAAKTTAGRLLRGVIDPVSDPLVAPPGTEEDLVVPALNARVVGLDNLTKILDWLSDALCRLLTGGGLRRRKRFADREETTIHVCRPVLLTAIKDVVTAPDLADRFIQIDCPSIPGECRLTEEEVEERFAKVWPMALGVLLDAAVAALQGPTSRPGKLSRMADFELWARAGIGALGFTEEQFASAYHANREGAQLDALQDSLVGPALLRFMETHTRGWPGTCAQLLQLLSDRNKDDAQQPSWPKTPCALRSELQRLKDPLRQAGLDVKTGGRDKTRARNRLLTLSWIPPAQQPAKMSQGSNSPPEASPGAS